MERDGACMVAIIKGLRDAGMTVTVVDDSSGQKTAQVLAVRSCYQVPARTFSVETNTEFLRCHAGGQSTDGGFLNSCQAARYGARTLSPPLQFSEFPPQRAEPDIIQGNFEIGALASPERSSSPQHSCKSWRGFASIDRGSFDSSRESNAFVHSLRKYPAQVSKTSSAELIQRLLTYTQTKNLTKSSYHTKSIRSLTDKNATADKQTRTNASKNIQTYARMKRSSKETGSTTDKDIKFEENDLEAKKSSKNNLTRSKSSNINFIYDYLKCSIPLRGVTGRSSDVRYLTDVKKAVRDTLRQMCQDRAVECPRIRSRYSQHRREHHKDSAEPEMNGNPSCSSERNSEDRASSPITREASMMTRCAQPVETIQSSSHPEVKICCICKKPLPSACKTSHFKNKSTSVEVSCVCRTKSSEFKSKIANVTMNWIKNIPVRAIETKSERLKRDNMVRELNDAVEKAIIEGDLEKVEQEIKKCLNDLPMWNPDEECEREIFKNKIAQDLKNKLDSLTATEAFAGEMANDKTAMDNDGNLQDQKSGVKNKEDMADNIQKEFTPNEISDVFDNSNFKSKRNIIDVQNRSVLKNLENIDNNLNNQTKEERGHLLQEEIDMPIYGEGSLDNSFVDKIKTIPLNDRNKSKAHDIKDISQKVTDVTNELKKKNDESKRLENDISNYLEDEIICRSNPNKVRDENFSLLHSVSIPEEQAERILDKSTRHARDMSTSYKFHDSRLSMRSQLPGDSFRENVETIIFDFIEDNCVYNSPNSKVKTKEMADNFIDDIIEKMSHSNYDKTAVNKEISKFLDNILIKSEIPKENLANKLMSMLLNVHLHCSTPYKNKFSFRPQRESTSSDISSVDFDKRDEEDKYSNGLNKIISGWVNDLLADFDTNIPKGFRETMIEDLVTNKIDRLKYSQLNPDAKLSDKDELEQLKYQIFRWLNKLSNIEGLTNIMPKTEALMNSINKIPAPLLVKDTNQWRDIMSGESEIPRYKDELEDEISSWLNEIPKDMFLSTNNKNHNEIIQELARKIQHVHNTGVNVDDKIMNLLEEYTKYNNKNKLHKYAQELINKLNTRGRTNEANLTSVQNTNQKLEENLTAAIMDWLRDLPLYKTRNPTERIVEEKIVADLAKDMIDAFESDQNLNINIDQILIDKITEHLMRFPMDMHHKTNQKFIKSIAQQLLHYLKGLQVFKNISRSSHQFEEENDNFEDWRNSLPLDQRQNSIENRQLAELTAHFKTSIKQLKQCHADSHIILEEILKYLKQLPIEPSKKSDDQYLKEKAQELLNVPYSSARNYDKQDRTKKSDNKTSNIEFSIESEVGFKETPDILYETIENFCRDLPVYGNDKPEEKDRVKELKRNLANRLINKIKELNMDPEVFFDDLKYMDLLKNEIDNLLSVIPINKDLMQNPTLSLINQIKEVIDKNRNKLAGPVYKKQLREAISKVLSSDYSDNEDDEAFLEVLKEDVADAFINLHYFGGKQDLRNKFKTKINDKITQFCNNYLKRWPCSPIDSSKLNKRLYIALKNVSMPTDESVRNEVEETRMKDEIQEWMKELPLKIQNNLDKRCTNKIISIMAKHLHDIENDKKFVGDDADKLKHEIMKWMKEIPLETEVEFQIEHFVDQLVERLKNTEESRHFDNTLIESLEEEPTDKSSTSQSIPLSSLTSEDHTLLQRIKDRNCKTGKCCKKDASVSPRMNGHSQTGTRLWDSITTDDDSRGSASTQAATGVEKISKISPRLEGGIVESECLPSCKHAQKTTKLDFNHCKRTPCEISPQVTVKEYCWDSTLESSSFCENQPCVTQRSRQPSCLRRSSPRTIPTTPYLTPHSCTTRQESHYLPSQQAVPEELPCPKQHSRFNQPDHRSSIKHPYVTGVGSSTQDSTPKRLNSKCPVHFPNNSDLWTAPCSRRRVLSSEEDIERPCVMERVNSSCWEHEKSKCLGHKRSHTCQVHEDCLSQCPKCCGMHCPHPSYLYFR